MADFGQSVLLQSLGWAIINSLWQMGLLWCVYLLISNLLRLSAATKHHLSAAAIFVGFLLFGYNIYSFETFSSFIAFPIAAAPSLPSMLLTSASVAYLLLLIIPLFRFIGNWQYVQHIRSKQLQKAAAHYRIYVRTVALQLNIKVRVQVFVSALVKSPVTVGFIKPVILLPLAAVNHLSTAQVESVLLHELSHVRRYDYVVNVILNIVHAILYFNPFVKLFMQQIDAERENCCDELVLQYGYDRVAYCSALLSLEKASQTTGLALSMAGNNNLLSRIETIAGMKKKQTFGKAQLVSALAAIVCIFALNSALLVNDTAPGKTFDMSAASVINPLHFIDNGLREQKGIIPELTEQNTNLVGAPAPRKVHTKIDVVIPAPQTEVIQLLPPIVSETANGHFIPVAFDEINGSLSRQEKDQVKETVEVTRDVLSTLQWQEVENSMADALDATEKNLVKEQYEQELEAVNWENLEQNLKANFDKIDWAALNAGLKSAKTAIELERLENTCLRIKTELERALKEVAHAKCAQTVAMPDESVEALKSAKMQVCRNLELIRSLKDKKTIRL